jgi:hypothetical protein
MTLQEALSNQGHLQEEIKEIILEMVNYVMEGGNPEGILWDYGLEPDYVMDLLDLCL